MGKKVRMGIFGSCTTREVFTTYYNDYKEHFNLVFSHERESFISLFDEPLCFDENQLKLYPDSKKNQFRSRNMINDLSKSFLEDLKRGIDFLIIDVYFEVLFGILKLDNGHIITNNKWDLPKTEFYKNLGDYDSFEIYYSPEEYFELWTKYCDKFFNHLAEFYPDVIIILNKIKLADRVFKEDYSYYINEDFRWMVNAYSPHINRLESYIEENYDVIVIEYDQFAFTSEKNRWSPYVVHFTPDYYKFIYLELCKIAGIDESHINSSYLEYAISKLELYDNSVKKVNSMIKSKDDEIFDLKNELIAKEKIIQSNNIELNDLREFKSNVLDSTSWKITEPLRNSKIFGKLQNK